MVPEKSHCLTSKSFPFPKRSFESKDETRSFRAEWCDKHSCNASTDAHLHDDRSREEIQGKYHLLFLVSLFRCVGVRLSSCELVRFLMV